MSVDWLRPGIYNDIPMADYQADPCKTPSLSSGIAHRLVTSSPLHAWTAHPQLNPNYKSTDKTSFDVGTVAHELLLRGEDIVEIIDATDWRTNAAKDARAEARKAGLVPLLAGQWGEVQAMILSVRAQLGTLDLAPAPFTEGTPEVTLIWEEDGILCRARLDWLHADKGTVDDLKTTSVTANPHVWSRRTFWSIGCDIQIALYLRGLKALTGVDATWRYVVAECTPPYGLSVVSVAPSALELGQRKVDYAIRKWRECLAADDWPGYPPEVAYVEMDSWQDADFLRLTYGEPEGAAA